MVKTPLYLLILIAMGSPIALNALLPALPLIANDLAISPTVVQFSLSIYLASLAIGQLMVGGVINAVGLKNCLLLGLFCFTAGGILGLLHLDVSWLLVGRVLQGLGGATMMAVSRAFLLESYGAQRAAEKMGFIIMAIAMSQAIAPLLGSLLIDGFGWRAIFLFTTIHGALLGMLVLQLIPKSESNAKRTDLLSTFALYRDLLGNHAFRVYALSNTALACAFYFFVAAAPHMSAAFDGDTHEFGYWFMSISLAFMLGGFLSTFLNRRLAIDKTIKLGNAIAFAGALSMLILIGLFPIGFAILFIPMCLVTLGRGISQPSYQSAALGRLASQSGMAAGLMGFLQLTCGAIVSQMTPALLAVGNLVIPIAILGSVLVAAYSYSRLRLM